jgi:hypothetical protein
VLTCVAASLILLDAHPLTRVLRLTIDDVLHDNGEVGAQRGPQFSALDDWWPRFCDGSNSRALPGAVDADVQAQHSQLYDMLEHEVAPPPGRRPRVGGQGEGLAAHARAAVLGDAMPADYERPLYARA